MQPNEQSQTPTDPQPQVVAATQTPPVSESSLIPPIPTEPVKKSFPVVKVVIILIVIVLLGVGGYIGYRNYMSNSLADSSDSPNSPTAEATPSDPATWTERKFEKLGLTFKAPNDLTLEESVDESGQLASYIQNDKIGQEFFQMYFVYQNTGKKVGEKDIGTFKNDARLIIPGTARDIEVDGFPGFAGQVADKQKRFISAIVKDGYWLIIYTAESTQPHKELSERIISTFKFVD